MGALLRAVAGVLLVASVPALGAAAESAAAPADLAVEDAPQPLFEDHETLPLTLDLPFAKLNRDRMGEPEYFPATLTYPDPEAGAVTLPVEVRTRGKTRRRKDFCEFPPLRVRFDETTLAATPFASQKSLKLVTHCQDRDSFDQYVLLEYLAYRIQNLLTEYGQRVRLVRVQYMEGKRRLPTRYGILLEDWRRVAVRTGTTDADVPGAVRIESLSVPDMNRVAVFNYMIGNQDWSAIWPEPKKNCCHNTRPLFTEQSTVIPLTYDFDFSGLVDAPYAVARPPNNDVRRRRYEGLCHTQTDLADTLPLFRDKREAIYELIRNQPGLRPSKVKSTLNYLDRFYAVINDPQQVQRKLVGACKDE